MPKSSQSFILNSSTTSEYMENIMLGHKNQLPALFCTHSNNYNGNSWEIRQYPIFLSDLVNNMEIRWKIENPMKITLLIIFSILKILNIFL